MKTSFWGLFRTNFCGHFRKLFLFTKYKMVTKHANIFLSMHQTHQASAVLRSFAQTITIHDTPIATAWFGWRGGGGREGQPQPEAQ